MSTITWNIR